METPALIRRAILRGERRPSIAGQSAASRRRGEGYEFAELRGYVHGDDPRRIDWAATARAGTLQTKVMLEEHALFLVSILDESPSMHVGRKRAMLEVARDALLLWNEAIKTGDRCILVSEEETFEARGASPEIAAHACAARSLATKNIEQALRHMDVIAPLYSAVLVITDGWSEIEEATLHRIASRHDTTILLTRDPWHAGFPLRGFVRMQDAETGRQRRLFITAADELRYLDAVREREASLRTRFENAGWRFGLLDEDPHTAFRQVFSHQSAHESGSRA